VHAPTPSARGAEPLCPFPSVCLPSRCARMLKFDTISGPTESRRAAACSPRNTQRSARALARSRVRVRVRVVRVCVCVCVSCALISIVGTTPRWAADATRAYDSCSGSGRGQLVARQIPRRASVNQRRTVCDYGPTGANWLQHRRRREGGSLGMKAACHSETSIPRR
jgi:hypothetical protein